MAGLTFRLPYRLIGFVYFGVTRLDGSGQSCPMHHQEIRALQAGATHLDIDRRACLASDGKERINARDLRLGTVAQDANQYAYQDRSSRFPTRGLKGMRHLQR